MDLTHLTTFVQWVDPLFLWYFATVNLIYLFVLLLGAIQIYRRYQELQIEDLTSVLNSNALPKISFITPFYNEADLVVSKVCNLLSLSYRYKEIILVNDGSTDHTMKVLKEYLQLVAIPKLYTDRLQTQEIHAVYQSQLYPEIIVIDKENGRKFDAMNAGLNAATHHLFIATDADTWIDDEGFKALIRPLFTHPDAVAVGASVRIKNGCKMESNQITTAQFPHDFLSAMQTLEYLRSFMMRKGWDVLQGNFVISGAFSIFPRDLIINIGGFCPSVAEDMEIVLRLQRIMRVLKKPCKIFYVPDPVAWTEGPSTWKKLGKQRCNWHRGTAECVWYHKTMMHNPRYGLFGLFVYPFWLWAEVFEPFIEILGFLFIFSGWLLGILSFFSCLLLISITLCFTFVFTILCLFIEEISFKKYKSFNNLVKLILYNFIENIGYRQMTLLWRCRGIIHFFKRFKEVQAESRLVNHWVKQSIRRGKVG